MAMKVERKIGDNGCQYIEITPEGFQEVIITLAQVRQRTGDRVAIYGDHLKGWMTLDQLASLQEVLEMVPQLNEELEATLKDLPILAWEDGNPSEVSESEKAQIKHYLERFTGSGLSLEIKYEDDINFYEDAPFWCVEVSLYNTSSSLGPRWYSSEKANIHKLALAEIIGTLKV